MKTVKTLANLRQAAVSRRADERMAKEQRKVDHKHTERELSGLFYETMLDELANNGFDRAELAPLLKVGVINPFHGEPNRQGQAVVSFYLNVVDEYPIEFSVWFRLSSRRPAKMTGVVKRRNDDCFWFVQAFAGKRHGFVDLGDAILFAEEQLEAAEIYEAECGYEQDEVE